MLPHLRRAETARVAAGVRSLQHKTVEKQGYVSLSYPKQHRRMQFGLKPHAAHVQAGLDPRVGRAGRTWVALQLGSGHCSEASSTGPLQVLTFCAVQVPTGWQRQGIVMLAWLGTPPIQPADPSPRISVLPATAPAVRLAYCW